MTEGRESTESVSEVAGGPAFVRRSGPDVGFVSRVVAGETIIVPISGRVGDLEAIYTLNSVGSRIWALLERPMTLDGLTDAIARDFEVGREQAAADVREFVEALETRGLLSRSEAEVQK